MERFALMLWSLLFGFFLVLYCHGEVLKENNDQIYIVYMGATTSSSRSDRTHILKNSLFTRKKHAEVNTYKNGFSGFAAWLTEEEAKELGKQPGVVSVFPDPVLQLHTTRTWDFLQSQADVEIDSRPRHDSDASSILQVSGESDSIVGIVDTGIWPESESFSDKGIGPIPSRWKGSCMTGQDFGPSNCNRKLIGARYYTDPDSNSTTTTAEYKTARDWVGHGTHVGSTAAGNPIPNASYYNIATGTAKGGSHKSRIATYKVCNPGGCRGSAILAAFDDAIADGVDVLSLSLGSSSTFSSDFTTDPIAIGAFHATEKGITVVCSAGNDGPSPSSAVNVAPWIVTVAATTLDRDLQSNIVLGNKKVIKGEGINLANLQTSPVYPLILGSSATSDSGTEDEARNCNPSAMDQEAIKGKIVVCANDDPSMDRRTKQDAVTKGGGVGLILIDDRSRSVGFNSLSFPMTVISSKDARVLQGYVKSTRNPVATILPTQTVLKYKPAPAVAYFSSRGPSVGTKNILKPDIAAPGVNILASWIGNDTDPSTTPAGQLPPLFNIISGTSMSCPHVSGVAAAIKSKYPTWSPAAIRSAIMTTAVQMNNMKEPIKTHTEQVATPYDVGAGEVSPKESLQPGLIYDIKPSDYLQFLCHYGYDVAKIKLISSNLPKSFSCPKNSSTDMISNLNYPSIAVAFKNGGGSSRSITRTVTNVGNEDRSTIYTVSVDAPKGLRVEVSPDRLKFEKRMQKLSYKIMFSLASSSLKEDLFGMVTWTNGKYKVKSPFVVSRSPKAN